MRAVPALRRSRRIALAGLLVAAVVTAALLTRGDRRAEPAVHEPGEWKASTVRGADPVRPSERPVRDRSPEGAARTAARFLADLGSGENARNPERVEDVLRSHATVDLRRDAQRFVDGFRALAARLKANGATPLLRTAPLGYRVEAYDGRAASLAIWKVVIAGGDAAGVLAVFDTTRLTLHWTARGWRVAAFGADVPGPTPDLSLSSQTVSTDSGVLASVINGFRELRP